MKLYLQKIIIILFLFLSFSSVNSQEKTKVLEASFLNKKIELNKNKTFFNVLVINNISNEDIEFNLNINIPRDWVLIGNSTEKILITKNQTLNIPVRAGVSLNSLGGVGYSVNANLVDLNGVVLETASSFFSFPIKNDLVIKTNKKVQYFSHKELESTFSIYISNNGNVNELIDIKLTPSLNLFLNENFDAEEIHDNIEIRPKKDTTLFFKARINTNFAYKKESYFNINVDLLTKMTDSVINRKIWFRYVDWQYFNKITETKQPLIIKTTVQNIFNETRPLYRFNIYGRVLLKKNRDVFYTFENRNRSTTNANLWINSNWFVGYENKKTTIILGDYMGSFEQSMFGRGFFLSQKINENNRIKASITKRLEFDKTNYGISYVKKFKKNISIEPGLAYSIDKRNSIKNSIAFIRPSFVLKKNSFTMSLGVNQQEQFSNESKISNGYGYHIAYRVKIKKIKLSLTNDYGSLNYVGYYRGRFNLRFYGNYQLKDPNKSINFHTSNYTFRPIYSESIDLLTRLTQSSISFRHRLKKNLILNIGTVYNREASNNFSAFDSKSIFSTHNFNIKGGLNIFAANSTNSISLSTKIGVVSVDRYSKYLDGREFNPKTKESYTIAELRLNMKAEKFGILYTLFNGPREISQQFNYFYSEIFAKSFSIMPYYRTFLYKNNLLLSVQASYIKDLTNNNARFNTNNIISWEMKNNWKFQLINSISIQQSNANSTLLGKTSFYTSTYFEVSIKKIFGLKQPRIKYYNLNTVFFKDYNGDNLKDANEAGLGKIYTSIDRKEPELDLSNINYNNEFIPARLQSNPTGEVYYENIPEGEYRIKYKTTKKNKIDFYNEVNEIDFTINKDTTIYIPFKEKNKIFGRIILHRAKYSVEQYLLGNIKITVKGNNEIFTTLTNENGYFELYIPVTETYIVEISDAFSENFSLRKSFYNVRFNGYKQFEVTFDFDEKKPEIVFRDDEIFETENNEFKLDSSFLMQQTNLRGEIQSSKSLRPIFATVAVHNNTGELISEITASVNTGRYSTTFFTGDNYSLTVSFDGYWTHYEKLNINQITTFDYIVRNIVLQKIEKGKEIETNNLLFKPLKNNLSEEAKVELDNIIVKLKRNNDITFDVIGYTDNEESLKTDAEKLSADRAIAVMDYMITKGVASNRMRPKGLGFASGNTAYARKQNRRVELIVTGFNKEVKAH